MPKKKIVAQRGTQAVYLVSWVTKKKRMGYVADFTQGKRFNPTMLNAITGRGYWEDFPHDEKLLEQIEELPLAEQ